MRGPSRDPSHTRRRIAYEAARILAEQGDRDFERARRKAAERVGCRDRRLLPDNADILAELQSQQRLFEGPSHDDELLRLRRRALEAMQAFVRFEPRLVGPVLDGSADRNSPIQLHLFAETPEQLAHALLEKHIPWHQGERQLRYGDGSVRPHPLFTFEAGGHPVELLCLPLEGRREAPLSAVDNRPEERASIARVQGLLEGRDDD